MDDHPGTLARIAIRLADLECNILGLSVLPVPGGVLDEVVIRPPTGLTRRHLVQAIRDEGCECSGITDAEVRELVDASSAALTAAGRAVRAPDRACEVVRELLGADMVTTVPADEANPDRTEGGHRAVFALDGATSLIARRSWSPFVQLELARAAAMLDLLRAVRTNLAGPAVVTSADGASIVLRLGRPCDADALLALHERCSMTTLFQRYHTGMRTIPRRWLHRLLAPSPGESLLAVCGRDVIALGQLIPTGTGEASEVSLLVEDAWQGKGVGTAVLSRLVDLAAARGQRKLLAVCLPGRTGMRRVAARAGLAVDEAEGQAGTLRLTLPATG
jgi:GNAT superfamily N-acetyltransferase